MYPYHETAIERVATRLRADPEVKALLLAGSIAHGFESADSDVDLLIVVSEADHGARLCDGRLQFWTAEGCDWPGGYAEGKYLEPAFLARVAERGSEPARFAFQDARVLFSDLPDLDAALRAITRYPVEGKAERIARMVLFGGRMLLAHNERLYPYHKWLMRVLESAPDRPPDLMERIAAVYDAPSQATLLGLWACVKNFRAWEGAERSWAQQFMRDSELNWMEGDAPVEDL